jgi:hypothetical protein
MSAYDSHAWAEFGVAAAGAAAVLAGLVFVAVSINLDKVLAVRGLPGRAGESIVMFVGALIASLLLLVPQSLTALGVELIVSGAVVTAGLMLIVAPGLKHQAHHPRSWRVTRVVAALAACVPIVVAGLSVLAESGGGLYWLFAAVALAFVAAIGNAWVLLVEVVRDVRYRPAEAP